MKATRVNGLQLAKAFNQSVETLIAQLEKFREAGDPANTQALRKATRRLKTEYSVLPNKVRREPSVKRFIAASGKLAKATGRVRDLDTIVVWTSQVADAGDRKSLEFDLKRQRRSSLRDAMREAKVLRKMKEPSVDGKDLTDAKVEKRTRRVEARLSRKVDKEFEEFLTTQEVEVMHALRKDAKRLRHLLELTRMEVPSQFLARLRAIQDELGAIRDHDLVIDYLRSRVRLTSTRSLIREEIAKRHARLEDFVTKNRGHGYLVPVAAKTSR